MTRSFFSAIAPTAFILLFTYAALSKWLDYDQFLVQLRQSPLLVSMAGTVAWVVPAGELAICGLLTFTRTRLLGLYAALGLMTLFTAYIIAITRFSDNVPCSCGGVLQRLSWNQHLIVNLGFVFLAIAAILSYPHPASRFYCNNQAKPKTCINE